MSVKDFDTAVALQIARLPKSFYPVAVAIGYCATPLTWAGVFVVLLLLQHSDLPASLIICTLALPLASLIKFAFRRQRPPTIYAGGMRIKSYSFPSSHAYTAALGGGYLATLSAAAGLSALAVAAIIGAVVIGISRVYVGAHYPSDVIGGWLAGLLVIGVAILWA